MRVIWSLDKTLAIPVSNIKALEVLTIDEWCKTSKDEWKGGRYYVLARYTICTGASKIVFTSDSKEECMRFIETI